MPSPAIINNIRAMNRRYQSHHENGDHVLREGSQYEMARSRIDYLREIDPETGQLYTNGFSVAPGGLGKTIVEIDFIIGINTLPSGRYVLGDKTLGKRVLIAVPSNQLVDQWADRLLGDFDEETGRRDPSIFDDRFNEDNVGIYHADLSEDEKKAVLSKPVVIIVHDSAQILYSHIDPKTKKHAPLLRPEDFDCVLIDEVDDKVRGDATSRFYKEVFFPKCLVIGLTATPLFRSGKTIGDYLFGGKKPICEIVHKEAVSRKEIAPHINIIIRPEVDPNSVIQPDTNRWEDYSEAQQLRFIEQTGTDNALLEVIRVGRHPKTGKPLRDMMQLHQAVNVQHGIKIAQHLNEMFGSKYAEAVWGQTDEEMNDEMRTLIKWLLKTGELKAVVQCRLWGRGTDIPALEMTVQHAPTLSPNKLVQFHTRASRRHNGRKTALYLSPYIDGIDQLVIGEVLGGLYMIPDGYEFPATEGKLGGSSDPDPWPDIKGVKTYYTEKQLEMFATERHVQRYVNGLPVKQKHMLTLAEAAQLLGISQEVLNERVFAPLQEAYESKQAREKFVEVQDQKREEVLHVRGKMFPTWRIGFYQLKAREVFCIDQNLIPLCEHALYGRLDKAPPEVLDSNNVKRLLGCTNAEIEELWHKTQQAFFHRKPYERRTEIDGVEFSHDTFGFFRNREGASEFFFFPDALIPAYLYVYAEDKNVAAQWLEKSAASQCKTFEWLTESDVLNTLELNPILAGPETALVRGIFDGLKARSRGMRSGQEQVIEIGQGKRKQVVKCSKRWLPLADSKDQTELCVHQNHLEWIKDELGMESSYSQDGKTYRQSHRPTKYPSLDRRKGRELK